MLMKGARPVPEATNRQRLPSSWSTNLPLAPLMKIGSPTPISHSSGVKSPSGTWRMKNSYSDRSVEGEEMDIGRRMTLPSGPRSPIVAYWPGVNGNGSSSRLTATITRPSATVSHRLRWPL